MKIAAIVVGISEYNKKILDNVSRCYDLNHESVDIFIYNNNIPKENEKLRGYFGRDKIKVLKSIRDSFKEKECQEWIKGINNSQEFNDHKNEFAKFIKIKKEEFWKKGMDLKKKVSKHVPFIKDTDKFMKEFKVFSPYQWFQIYLATHEITKYENTNQFEYDFIIKIRLDFYLKYDRFNPIHYFGHKAKNESFENIVLKSYDNLKKYYLKVINESQEDKYHNLEFRVDNYLYWRTTKWLGGQYVLNNKSFDNIKDVKSNEEFNNLVRDNFIVTMNDFVFFAKGSNFKKLVDTAYNGYGKHFDKSNLYWWTPESQFIYSIFESGLNYLDYVQNGNFFKIREIWVNDYHGTEKYNKKEMATEKI